MPKNVPCRFHLQGRCNKGDACSFYHGPDVAVEPSVCRYFQRGFCANGENCRFAHPSQSQETYDEQQEYEHWESGDPGEAPYDQPELECDYEEWCEQLPDWPDSAAVDGSSMPVHVGRESSEANEAQDCSLRGGEDDYDQDAWELLVVDMPGPELKDRAVCPRFWSSGCCPSWQSCPYPHGWFCEGCQKWALHPYSEPQRIRHSQVCLDRAGREAARARSAAQECGICLEPVMEKPLGQRMFGLLSCEHAFCLGCVRGWRAHVDGGADVATALRSCPVCRQTTHYVTPSKVWPKDAAEKEAIVAQYKAKLASIDCKYWEASPRHDRRCPFGTSCFYRHKGQESLPPPRKLISADGDVKFGNPIHLSHFLEDLRL